MKRLPLLFFGLLLVGCTMTTPPAPAPDLQITRLDAHHISAQLIPAQARARWTLRQHEECGADNGPVSAAGVWPDAGPLVVAANDGDMLTVTYAEATGQEITVQDCVPTDI